MRQIQGDLIAYALAGEFDVIVHGANCMCTMGAGIAKRIREEFPEAYDADRETRVGDRAKLGTITTARILRPLASFTVVNAYTQYDWRGPGMKVDYEAVVRSMRMVAGQFSGHRIGYPMIGAGLAKGDWSVLSSIIDSELRGENHTLVVLPAR